LEEGSSINEEKFDNSEAEGDDFTFDHAFVDDLHHDYDFGLFKFPNIIQDHQYISNSKFKTSDKSASEGKTNSAKKNIEKGLIASKSNNND